MALATSNLSLKSILQTLGVSTPKAIFYISGTLKTLTQLGSLVNKSGLNVTYCPGANEDARLQSLLNDRKLSYFKGYEHVTAYLVVDPLVFNVSADSSQPYEPQISISVNGSTAWSAEPSDGWVQLSSISGSGNAVIYPTFSPNPEPTSREAVIQIASGGFGETIHIYQDANNG